MLAIALTWILMHANMLLAVGAGGALLYALLSGFKPSLTRATIALVINLGGVAVGAYVVRGLWEEVGLAVVGIAAFSLLSLAASLGALASSRAFLWRLSCGLRNTNCLIIALFGLVYYLATR